jgi:hypothetical protein
MIYTTYTVWLTVFAIVAYLIIVDQNVPKFIYLLFQICRVNIIRFFWMIRFHPRNPITNLYFRWKYARLAKEIQKRLDKEI